MKRAARALAAVLANMDPAHKEDYAAGLSQWNRKMDRLSAWARTELSGIPEADRILPGIRLPQHQHAGGEP